VCRILITGGRGLLGREVVERLASQMVAYTTFRTPKDATARGEALALDLMDRSAVRALFESWRPDTVVHTAAPRGPLAVEQIPVTTEHVAEAAGAIGARLVHLSTDMVFDGSNAPYAESDEPSPISPYGEAKLAAERAVKAHTQNHLVVRTSVIYGFEPLDHQTSWIVGALKTGEPVSLFVDEFRSPVWVGDLADAVAELALGELGGTLHVAGADRLSRWDFGRRVLDFLDLDPGEVVRPGRLAESGLHRPPDLTLDLERCRRVLNSVPRGVEEVLSSLRARVG